VALQASLPLLFARAWRPPGASAPVHLLGIDQPSGGPPCHRIWHTNRRVRGSPAADGTRGLLNSSAPWST